MVASYAIQAVTMKQQTPKAAALSDFEFPQSDEGTPQAVFFGDCWTTGWQVIWYGNYHTIKIKAKGGKK